MGGCCLPTNQALAPDRQRDPALHGRRLEVLGGDLVGLSSPRQAGDRRAEHRVEGIISLDAEIGVHAQLEPRQHAADQLDQLSARRRALAGSRPLYPWWGRPQTLSAAAG